MTFKTTKQDTRHLQDKIKDGFKNTEFRKYIRENFDLKKIACPKNKTKSVALKKIQFNFNDSLNLTVDELIDRCLKEVISLIKIEVEKNNYTSSFEMNPTFTSNLKKRDDIHIDITSFKKVRINDFTFYYKAKTCIKDNYTYDFVDPDLSREINQEEIRDVVLNHKQTTEILNGVFDVTFIFPLKK